MFPASDDSMLREAELLALEAKNSHQYTDLNKFTLKCLECGVHLVGQEGALVHAKETGHSKFGEFTRWSQTSFDPTWFIRLIVENP